MWMGSCGKSVVNSILQHIGLVEQAPEVDEDLASSSFIRNEISPERSYCMVSWPWC